jgi:beta-N-acetylhexosaminidase
MHPFLLAALLTCSGSLKGLAQPGEFRESALRIARALDDRRLAAQVIMTGIDGKGTLGKPMEALLRSVPAGAIMLFKYNLSIPREAIPPFLSACSALIAGITAGDSGDGTAPEGVVPAGASRDQLRPRIPPFIAVDHEGGDVHRFGAGVKRLPAPASYW